MANCAFIFGRIIDGEGGGWNAKAHHLPGVEGMIRPEGFR